MTERQHVEELLPYLEALAAAQEHTSELAMDDNVLRLYGACIDVIRKALELLDWPR